MTASNNYIYKLNYDKIPELTNLVAWPRPF